MKFEHEFVEYIPDHLLEGRLYVSIPYGTVVHKCACGCGEEVVTPLGPAEWRILYDGRSISLDPSIGNWTFSCRSHYWIDRNEIRWARTFSKAEIHRIRSSNRAKRSRYFKGQWEHDGQSELLASSEFQKANRSFRSFIKRLFTKS